MKAISEKRGKLILSGMLVFLLACCAPAVPPQMAAPPSIAPIPVRVLMLVPYDFESFTYVSRYESGGELRLPFGREAVDELDRLLGSAFVTFIIKPVSSEAEARDMLSAEHPGNPEVLRYDDVAIPKFMHVNSWNKQFQYGYDVDILLELYSTDGSKVTKVHGHGESSTGNLAGSSPQESGRLALRYAVEAIRDGVDGKRNLLLP